MKSKTYYVCYDTFGNGFQDERDLNRFAFNEEELKCCIAQLKEKRGIEDDRICIFELTPMNVKTKRIEKRKILEEWDVKIT